MHSGQELYPGLNQKTYTKKSRHSPSIKRLNDLERIPGVGSSISRNLKELLKWWN
jgi:hypothetical protein